MDEYSLLLISEEDEVTELLKTKIRNSTSFSRQRGKVYNVYTTDTILTWMDEETQIDLALSFQDSKGA